MSNIRAESEAKEVRGSARSCSCVRGDDARGTDMSAGAVFLLEQEDEDGEEERTFGRHRDALGRRRPGKITDKVA